MTEPYLETKKRRNSEVRKFGLMRQKKYANLQKLLVASALICAVGAMSFYVSQKHSDLYSTQKRYFINVIRRTDRKTLIELTESMDGMTPERWQKLFGKALVSDSHYNRTWQNNSSSSATVVPQKLTEREAELVLEGIRRHIRSQVEPNPLWVKIMVMIREGKNPDRENEERYLNEFMHVLSHSTEHIEPARRQ